MPAHKQLSTANYALPVQEFFGPVGKALPKHIGKFPFVNMITISFFQSIITGMKVKGNKSAVNHTDVLGQKGVDGVRQPLHRYSELVSTEIDYLHFGVNASIGAARRCNADLLCCQCAYRSLRYTLDCGLARLNLEPSVIRPIILYNQTKVFHSPLLRRKWQLRPQRRSLWRRPCHRFFSSAAP